jgi:hypothetical protein
MSDPAKDAPQGPTDPHGKGGIDAPAPPGGPQRADAPDGRETPGEAAPDPGKPTRHGTEPVSGGRSEADEPSQDEKYRDQQEENAATSLDEPSDGSGGE